MGRQFHGHRTLSAQTLFLNGPISHKASESALTHARTSLWCSVTGTRTHAVTYAPIRTQGRAGVYREAPYKFTTVSITTVYIYIYIIYIYICVCVCVCVEAALTY